MAAVVLDIQRAVGAQRTETPHLVTSRVEALCEDEKGAVRALLPQGCGVVLPPGAEQSLSALRVQRCTPTREMMDGAAGRRNALADGSWSSILLVGTALDYQPSGARFTSPITLRLPVWVDFSPSVGDRGRGDPAWRLHVGRAGSCLKRKSRRLHVVGA